MGIREGQFPYPGRNLSRQPGLPGYRYIVGHEFGDCKKKRKYKKIKIFSHR